MSKGIKKVSLGAVADHYCIVSISLMSAIGGYMDNRSKYVFDDLFALFIGGVFAEDRS
jgi:hypothetical protein